MKKIIFFAVAIFVVGTFFLFNTEQVNAVKPSDYGLKEGDLISAIFSDDPDVYIINDQGYKRLFLNPEIFKFYSHLGGFANIKLVTPEIRDSFPTSGFFRNCEDNDQKVFGTSIEGEDKGQLHWINKSGDQAVQEDPDFFKKVFCINRKEFDWYPRGNEFKTLKEVPQYNRNIAEAETFVICHHPSDDPNTFQTIRVAQEALDAHFQHGDGKGACSITCSPRPACLDATPRCLLSEPPGGWCPIQIGIAVPAPTPTSTPVLVPSSAALDNFARCLTEKGAVMYGVSECPYCQKQKDYFGSSFQYIKYVECPSNTQFCQEKGITAYPTWTFSDGSKLPGVQNFGTFSKFTGCVLLAPSPVPTPTPTIPSVAPVSITVVSPNGSEVYQKGTTQLIKWNSTNVSKIYIKLRKGNDTYPGPEGMITDVIPGGGGYYKWWIPTTLPDGNDYAIRIIDGNFTGLLDDSDAPFSIVATGAVIPTLKVLLDPSTPVGQNLTAGQGSVTFARIKITAGSEAVNNMNGIQVGSDSANASNILTNIKVYDGTTQLGTTATDLAYNGSYYYQWISVSGISILANASKALTVVADVKSTAISGNVRLGIAGWNFNQPGTQVEPFGTPIYGNTMTVAANTQPKDQMIRITSPNGGEQWTIGPNYTIQWENPGSVKSVYVDLYKGGVYLAGLGGLGLSYGAPTSWTWNTINTPNFAPGSDFKFHVRSDTDPTIYDESDNYFSISVSLPSPTTCDYLKSGKTTSPYFGQCSSGGFDNTCFNKFYSTFQGCTKNTNNDCTVNNANASQNILCPVSNVSTSTPTPTTQSNFSRNLTMGSTGDDVKQLQALLVNEVGYSADLITGYFGRITRDAVKRFQEKYGVRPISGYFGEITRKVLNTFISGQ